MHPILARRASDESQKRLVLYSNTVFASFLLVMKYAPLLFVTTMSVISACSPPAEPTGRGGTHFRVASPLDSALRDEGKNCAVPVVGGIGSPRPDSETGETGPPQLPTAGSKVPPTQMGSKVSDGQRAGPSSYYEVDCKITGENSYSIEAYIVGPNGSEFAGKASGETSIRLRGSVNASTGLGNGIVDVRTTETGVVPPTDGTSCSLTVLTDPQDATKFRIKPGAVDLTFECANTTPPIAELSRCMTLGTVTLENCVRE